MEKYPITKSTTPTTSKTSIITWLKSIFSDMPTYMKIQDFGDGILYCRLLSHYFGNPPNSKITFSPKNQYQYVNNLKHVQTALQQLGIGITFDVARVSKRKFLQNWALINAFYRYLNSPEEGQPPQQNSTFSNHQLLPTPINIPQLSKKLPKKPHPTPTPTIQQPRPPNKKLIQQPQQQSTTTNWDHPSPTNLGLVQLAQNSLQITQLLKQHQINHQSTNNKSSSPTQLLQNNHNPIVDRIKQILLKGTHDIEKVRQVKMVLCMPLEQEQVIKIQDDYSNTVATQLNSNSDHQPPHPIQPIQSKYPTDFQSISDNNPPSHKLYNIKPSNKPLNQ